MSFYSEMIKPLLAGVIKNLKSPEADEKSIGFLSESVKDDKLWQLTSGYDDILFRIKLYRLAVSTGATGTDYTKFVSGGVYYKGVLAAIDKRFATENRYDINAGYLLAEKDPVAASENFSRAAHRFSGEGAFCYGITLLAAGDKDEDAAFWFRISAECGYPKGMVNLALCYRYGSGIRTCVTLALVWLSRAVMAGEATAKTELIDMYKYGDGTDTDFAKAYALSRGSDEEIKKTAEDIIKEYTE